MSAWWLYVPGLLIVIAWAVTFRWLGKLQGTLNGLGQRVARLEGASDRDD